MPTSDIFVRHLFSGGWATDFGPTTDVVPDANNILRIPFLVNAEDTVYEFDGGPRKAPGTSRLNSAALESGATIKGLVDFWVQGTAGSSTQKRVIHINTVIKKDDADGAFTDIFTGLETDKVPGYSVFDDILIMASDSTVDVPKSWNQSTAQDLAGTPPNFAFSATHRNRSFAAGDAANPSRLYYSANVDPEDWVGAGSGSIDVDPNDGDRITGIISHKNELWVFKGPYSGSIHRVTGSAPTGSDAFALNDFIKGLGAVGQNTLFRFRDDIGFMWSDGTIHSLKATAAFGDFNEASLSRPIHNFIRDHFNFDRLMHAWAATTADFGLVVFTVPIDGSSDGNYMLVMDYRFDPVRWASWPTFGTQNVAGCVAPVVASGTNQQILMAGGTDGFVRSLLQADRSIDGTTGLSYKVTTPYFNYGNPIMMKTLSIAALGIQPKNNGNLTFGWQRDDNAQQTETIAQGGSDVLGTASANQFTLGTSTLGGSRFVDRFRELAEGGEFRAVQYEVSNSVNQEDAEVHSLSTAIIGGGWSAEN